MTASETSPKKRILETNWGTYEHGERELTHSHQQHFQLKWPSSGVARIHTPGGLFVLPPTRALWIPPRVPHGGTYLNGVRELSLYVDEEHVGGLPRQLLVTVVSPRLQDAIEQAVQHDESYDTAGRQDTDQALIAVVAAELCDVGAKPLDIVLPHESRVQPALEAIRRRPNDDATLADWASRLDVSERTLTRLFKQETGVSFGNWRKRARLLYALERLASGADVSLVSRELGYRSDSAFIYMFRREFGTTPGQYYQHDAQ